MRHGDSAPGQEQPGDDQRRNVSLDEDFVKAAPVKEEELRGPAGDPPPKRVWPRNLVLALGAAALTVIGFRIVQPPQDTGSRSASAPATAAAIASTAPAAGAPASGRPQIPLDQAFPAVVKASGTVFTRVGSATLPSCTEADSVGRRLIALIKAGKGCAGEQIALYKDGAGNQFNLAVFTMKDPLDTVHLVTQLSLDFEDFEVGAQAPPPGSGLATLPPDSAMVQAFQGGGRAMLVTLGQWSDGRPGDRRQLVDRLKPLQEAVGNKIFAYETQN
jgi:hypothetical protein